LFGIPQRADYHPEIDTGTHVMMVIDMAARLKLSLPARFAALTHDLGKGQTPADVLPRHIGHELASARLLKPLCERLRVPTECRDLALLVAQYHGDIHRADALRPATMVKLLERCDVLRRPERFEDVLAACECDYRGRLGFGEKTYPQAPMWRVAMNAICAVDAGEIARSCHQEGQARRIAESIHQARVVAVAALNLQKPQQNPE
jgi:tRNA nucleotidyltransferase (CCA-adding enzyme)